MKNKGLQYFERQCGRDVSSGALWCLINESLLVTLKALQRRILAYCTGSLVAYPGRNIKRGLAFIARIPNYFL